MKIPNGILNQVFHKTVSLIHLLNAEIKLSRYYNYINKGTNRHFCFMLPKTQTFTVYLAHKKYYPYYHKILSLEVALALELIWLGYG